MMHPDDDALARRVARAIGDASDAMAALDATVTLLKRERSTYTWVGVYLLVGNELVLGPYDGKPSLHTRIPLGRGICGAAAADKTTIIVDDVHRDPRYLACSLETRSEIVVPIMKGGEVLGEIDVDSDLPAAFGDRDRAMLEAVAARLADRLGAQDHT